jgi:hypothetical protein
VTGDVTADKGTANALPDVPSDWVALSDLPGCVARWYGVSMTVAAPAVVDAVWTGELYHWHRIAGITPEGRWRELPGGLTDTGVRPIYDPRPEGTSDYRVVAYNWAAADVDRRKGTVGGWPQKSGVRERLLIEVSWVAVKDWADPRVKQWKQDEAELSRVADAVTLSMQAPAPGPGKAAETKRAKCGALVEGVLFIPKGHLPLREAVIRLAERRAPDAGARKYLEVGQEGLWQAMMANWPADVLFDWKEIPRVTATAPPSPAWGALEAARDELWQALGDADLLSMSLSNGGLSSSQPERWRVREGFEAFQSERLGGDPVLLCEADFARWMAGASPTVATKSDATTPAPAAELQYPAIGDVPEHRHLTACEVLTWIGYGRAISRDVYFAKVSGATATAEARLSLLHQSVPDPKPLENPMDDAERKLMEEVRAGRVHSLIERNGAFEEPPAAIYEHAVAVNARGSIEADGTAPERDQTRARSYLSSLPPIGNVWFRKSEVLEVWPSKAPTAIPGDSGQPHHQPFDAVDPEPTPAAPRRGKGRPGVRETCLALFRARRESKIPLLLSQSAEANEIVRAWPSDGPRKPQPATVSGHIAEVWIVADKMCR